MDKIIKILLIILIFAVAINLFHINKTNEQYLNEIDRINDKIKKLEQLINEKKDTIKIFNNYETKIIKQIDSIKNEITNTNNIDSLIVLYYKYRSSYSN